MTAYAQHLQPLANIRWLTALLSLLLSGLAIALNDMPNNDAYTYIRAGHIVLEQGISAAYQYHQWAHLSVLMAGIHTLTGLSLLSSAYLLNTVLFAMLSVAFVNLVAALATNRRTVWLAMIVVLVYPHLNEFRPYVIRDIGFLAFAMLAMLQLLLFNRSLQLRYGLMYVAYCLAGALFRPEIILMLFVGPVSLLMNKEIAEINRRRGFFRLQALAALCVLVLAGAFAALQFDIQQLLGAFVAIYQPFLSNVRALFVPDAAFASAAFGDYAAQFVENYSGLFLFSGLLTVLIAVILESLGLVVAPLLAAGLWRQFPRIDSNGRHILLLWGGTALFILIGFIFLTRFSTTRYTLLLAMVLLVVVPFIIDHLWRQASARGQNRLFYMVAGLLLSFQLIDSHVSMGASRAHLEHAQQWIQGNTRSNATFLTNEIYLAYESGRVEDFEKVRRDMPPETLLQVPAGSILALTPRRSFEAFMQAEIDRGALRLLQRFPAERGADLLVFEKVL